MAKIYKFDSGLMLLYEKNKINKSTVIDIGFNCGSRCDGDLPGLSHFCEHMFFAGTDKLSKQEVAKRYFDLGNVNAFTSTEDIRFKGRLISSRLAEYLTAVQDMVCNSTFTASAVEEEKKIVIQEIVQDADNFPGRAYEFESYGLYGLKYYINRELGNAESVNSITSKDVKKYVKKYFVKNNCIISVCSALSFVKVKNTIKKYFDNKMPSNQIKPLPYREDKFVPGNNIQMHKDNIGKNFVTVFLKHDQKNLDIRHRVHMNMISNIISDFGNGISKELRIENSLVYSVRAYCIVDKVNSGLVISTEISKENIKPCLDIIFKYLIKLKNEGVSNGQFAKEINDNEYYWQTDVVTPSHLCRNLRNVLLFGKYISPKDMYEEYKKVSYEELNDFIKRFIQESEIMVSVYGDADKKDVYTLKQIEKIIGGKLC